MIRYVAPDKLMKYPQRKVGLRHLFRELYELGAGGAAFRIKWEFQMRSGLAARMERPPPPLSDSAIPSAGQLVDRLPFSDPAEVAAFMKERIEPQSLTRLASEAAQSASGRILCFGRWVGDYGHPIDWKINPTNGRRWSSRLHWSRALGEEKRVGDVKLTWEIARFPHAYQMVRAAAMEPSPRNWLASELAAQVESFAVENPYGRGIHWASGQEIVFRLMAWLFALAAIGPNSPFEAATSRIVQGLHDGAVHIERHLDYTRKAIYNNHLLSEALGLLLAGTLIPGSSQAARWRTTGLEILTQQADAQVYPDGAYIQQSHNYQRVAMQVYLWAAALLRKAGEPIPSPWLGALDRSLVFLLAHQNPSDGRLPNYGANDGALPSVFTACDFSDFRPLLQAASVLVRRQRLYAPGPWDEECAWLFGPRSLDAPLAPPVLRSVSFRDTGYHVLRGHEPGSFSAFRCGTVKDRFSQIDMLALDVWWRGENVLVDGGSYLYNGPQKWHGHFLGTSSHNTASVDGRDQMLHLRRFKSLYWTRAELLAFTDHEEWALCEGEHYGFTRHPGKCVHRRSVLFIKDDLWIVADRVFGAGDQSHDIRLHWLGGEYPHAYRPEVGTLTLETPAGPFSLTVLDVEGRPIPGDVIAGSSDPPRGWLSRYYGEKKPVPSLAVEQHGPLPITLFTLLSPERAAVEVTGNNWTVTASHVRTRFKVDDGRFSEISVERDEPEWKVIGP